MSNLRFEAVSEASKRKPVEVTAPSERPSEFFGKKVFNRQKGMKKHQAPAERATYLKIPRSYHPCHRAR